MGDRPPPEGRLVIIEPWVPEDQGVRSAMAVQPAQPEFFPTWIFEVSEPIDLDGVVAQRLRLKPRFGDLWVPQDHWYSLDGCLDPEPSVDGEPPPYRGLIAQYIGRADLDTWVAARPGRPTS